MKKFIVILLLLPSFLFADVIKDYQKQYSYLNTFKVESSAVCDMQTGETQEVKVILRKFTQYCFIAQGTSDFHFQIIEASGNTWEGIFSRGNKMISLENVMDGGIYTIKIYSFSRNRVKLYWGEY